MVATAPERGQQSLRAVALIDGCNRGFNSSSRRSPPRGVRPLRGKRSRERRRLYLVEAVSKLRMCAL